MRLTRRRRRWSRAGALALALASVTMQGCCDPVILAQTSSGDGSSTGEEGSAETTSDATETEGEPVLPEWALGTFSGQADQVGMSFNGTPYWWSNVEMTAEGAFYFNLYSCAELQLRQEFRWRPAEDGNGLSLHTVSSADVFTFGNGHQVSEVIVEPGSSCGIMLVRYHQVDPDLWVVNEYQRGNVCARTTGPDSCTFTFEWCDGTPPPACD